MGSSMIRVPRERAGSMLASRVAATGSSIKPRPPIRRALVVVYPTMLAVAQLNNAGSANYSFYTDPPPPPT